MKIYGKRWLVGLTVRHLTDQWLWQTFLLSVLPNESVQIDGALDQYNYGDNISLVCKAGKSWPQAQIHWFINGKLVRRLLRASKGASV